MIFYSFLLLVITIYFWYKWKIRRFENFTNDIPENRAYTLLGNLENLVFMKNRNISKLMNWIDELPRKHLQEGIMKFWMLHLFSVVIWRHDFVEAVATNPKSLRKGKIFQYLLGNSSSGLLLNEGTPEVKELRQPILQMMKKVHLDTWHHPAFVKHTKEFVEYLKNLNSEQVNIWDGMLRVSFELFGDTSVGVGETAELKKVSLTALFKLNRLLSHRLTFYSKLWPFAVHSKLTSTNREEWKWMYNVMEWIVNYRKQKIKECTDNAHHFVFFTDALIKKGMEKRMSDREINQEVLEGILAGSVTSSIVLSSLLVFLAIHRDVQEQVYQEQVDLFGDDITREPSPDDLPKMELLSRVVKETLRLVSAPFFHKQATDDMNLGEYVIPKDSYIIVHLRQLHRNPAYWERPEEFFPDHFLPEQVQRRPDYAYVPFGIGIRRCPGERYGVAALTTITSILVRNFKFSSKWAEKDLVYEIYIICGFQHRFYNLSIENRCG